MSSPVCAGVGAAADLVFPVPALLAGDLPEADLPAVPGVAELLASVLVLYQLGANPDIVIKVIFAIKYGINSQQITLKLSVHL